MSKRNRLVIEGEVSRATLQVVLDKVSERLDRLEGRSGGVTLEETLTIVGTQGTLFRVGNFTINRYGADLEKYALASGARMDSAGQWIALQTKATIQEMDTTQNIKYYYNTGLTPEKPYTPTLELTVAL